MGPRSHGGPKTRDPGFWRGFADPIVPGAEATAAGIRLYLAERLAQFKVPRTIRILEELPAMGSGKVDAAALRSLVSDPDGR